MTLILNKIRIRIGMWLGYEQELARYRTRFHFNRHPYTGSKLALRQALLEMLNEHIPAPCEYEATVVVRGPAHTEEVRVSNTEQAFKCDTF
jgi:hypothetical protein